MAHLLGITSTTKTFRVAVVGVGLVGAELVKQLQALDPSPFRLVSLASSKSLLYHPDGLAHSPSDGDGWKDALASAGRPPDLQFLLRELAALVKPGQEAVLVDNTSAQEVAALYPAFLRLGVNVVTPNKKAFSGGLELYEQILGASLESGAKFLNEATVGAGLPVISTLKDLIATGDKVRSLSNLLLFLCVCISAALERALRVVGADAERGRAGHEDRGRVLGHDELHLQRVLDGEGGRPQLLVRRARRAREGLHGTSPALPPSSPLPCHLSFPFPAPHPPGPGPGLGIDSLSPQLRNRTRQTTSTAQTSRAS